MSASRRSPYSADGFTLLELMIVITLIVLITGIFASSVGGGFGVHIRNSGRALAAELEYVSQRAVTTGRAQRFVIDRPTSVPRRVRAAARARAGRHAARARWRDPRSRCRR
jgi:prepilin-type N-terminal cleavage/methylation domain-containing protein